MTGEPRRFARELRKQATSAEDILWQALRGRRFMGMKVRRQVPLLTYTVDFLCFDHKLVVELDGRQHAWFDVYDRRRTVEIEAHGFTLLRFANAEVLTDLDAVLHKIRAAAPAPSP